MKITIAFILLFAGISAFATNNLYLDKNEQQKVAIYLSNICPDTYCGGDTNWRSQSLECSEKECILTMSGTSYEKTTPVMDLDTFKSLSKSEKESGSAKLLALDLIKEIDFNDEPYETTELYTECTLDLPFENEEAIFEDKKEAVYFATLDCVDELQAMIWKINL